MSFEEFSEQEPYSKMKSVVIVSDIFSNIKELKEAIFHDMISKHYETSIVESGPTKYIVKYFDNTCKWRLHAS